MFASINFLFLISLAITSWIILCYLKQLEAAQEQMSLEINMSSNFEDLSKQSCQDSYETYLNFLCIFAAIYALAKITQVTENYIARNMYTRFGKPRLSFGKDDEPKSIEEYRLQRHELQLQISYLEKENSQLEQCIKELKQSNFVLMSKCLGSDVVHRISQQAAPVPQGIEHGPLPERMAASKTDVQHPAQQVNSNTPNGGTAGNGQQVFISNQHFHLTRQYYVEENNASMNFADMNLSGGGDIPQVWQKYLKMQKYALQKPTTASNNTPYMNNNNNPMTTTPTTDALNNLNRNIYGIINTAGNQPKMTTSNENFIDASTPIQTTPMVVSTEDLQNMQGLY